MATFQIKSRFSGAVLFETEIAAEFESAILSVRLGMAVRAAYKSGADLRGAYLRGAYLRGAYLSGANLSGASLSGADLSGANLRGAYLSGANLIGASLSGAYLIGADLSGANLIGADLSGANLSGAYLRGADLSVADLSGAEIIRIIARATRLDDYEFIAFETDKGVIIRAGCWTMSLAEYRDHVAREYPNTDKAEETLAILDYIEARAAALCKVECR